MGVRVFTMDPGCGQVRADAAGVPRSRPVHHNANQLDEALLATAAERATAWRIDAAAVRSATGFPVGGVPPFGHRTTMGAFVDVDLLAFDVLWAAAGTPSHVFALSPADLRRATGALPVRLAKA